MAFKTTSSLRIQAVMATLCFFPALISRWWNSLITGLGRMAARAAIYLWLSVPNSGSSQRSVDDRTGPAPGTLLMMTSFPCHMGVFLMNSWRSLLDSFTRFSNHETCRWISFFTRLLNVLPRRFFSAVSISTIWSLLVCMAFSSRVCSSLRGRACGLMAWPKLPALRHLCCRSWQACLRP